jgi:hypothetical protein
VTGRDTPTREIFDQLAGTYRLMAGKGRYRPAAPSDGFGHITVPVRELSMDAEIMDYAAQWWGEEESREWHLGCPTFDLRPAMVLAVEAARACCGGDRELAARLLDLAARRASPCA